MLGRNLTSLTSITFCFFFASFFFFCSSYLYFPKSRILQTGGSALGAISTKSSPASAAMSSPSLRLTTPTISPCSSTKRICGTEISPLIRGPSRVGVVLKGGLAIYVLLRFVEPAVPAFIQAIKSAAERRLLLLIYQRLRRAQGLVAHCRPAGAAPP